MSKVIFQQKSAVLKKWKVKEGTSVTEGSVLCDYFTATPFKLKSKFTGTVSKLLIKEGDEIKEGDVLALIDECQHQTRWKNVCADCGVYLFSDQLVKSASGSSFHAMEHSIPDLLVHQKTAMSLGKNDERCLLENKRLVLLLDLDHTLIHTTTNNVIGKGLFHFQLPNHHGHPIWYHTKFRPGIKRFLTNLSQNFEMHIYTFGIRSYAHAITRYMDPEKKFFQNRILSRNECFHPTLKTLNLGSLFPCGDHMVVIIDDREDVWQWAPNLIRVKPFVFFEGFGDLNAPELNRGEGSRRRDGGLKRKRVSLSSAEVKCSKVEQDDLKKDNGDKESAETKDTNENPPEAKSAVFSIGDDVPKENNGHNNILNSENEEKSDNKHTKNEVETKEVVSEEVGDGEKGNEEKTSIDKSKNISAETITKNKNLTNVDEEQKSIEKKNDNNQFEKPRSILKSSSKENVKKRESAMESDNYLLHLEAILMRVHACFYSVEEPLKEGMDLKKIIPQERSKVLKTCKIVFSGVVPMNTPIKQSWVHHLAVRHGAEVMEGVVKGKTTHVVGVRDGTEKVRQALKVGNVKVVNFDWLVESIERWTAQDESKYAIKNGSKWFLWYQNNLASRGFAKGHFVTPKNDFLIDKTLKEEIFSSNGFEDEDVEESNEEDESWLEKMMEDFEEADDDGKDEEGTRKDKFDDTESDEKNYLNTQKEEMCDDTSSSDSNGSESEDDMAKFIEDKFCNHD